MLLTVGKPTVFLYGACAAIEANKIFLKALKGGRITEEEQDKYKGYLLVFLGGNRVGYLLQ